MGSKKRRTYTVHTGSKAKEVESDVPKNAVMKLARRMPGREATFRVQTAHGLRHYHWNGRVLAIVPEGGR